MELQNEALIALIGAVAGLLGGMLGLGGAIIIIPAMVMFCLLYTSPSPRDRTRSRMPSSA